ELSLLGRGLGGLGGRSRFADVGEDGRLGRARRRDVAALGRDAALGVELRLAELDRVHELREHDLHGANGVVVARDDDVDLRRVRVGVDDADRRDAHLEAFLEGDVLAVRVDDDDGRGEPVHLADALEVPEELALLAVEARDHLLRVARVLFRRLERLDLLEALEPAADRLVVRERAAEPALRDVVLPDARRLVLDELLELRLGADDEDLVAGGDDALEEVRRPDQALDGLAEIDQVDRVPLAVDERGHLRVPARAAVPEVDAGVDQLFEGDDGRHSKTLREDAAASGQSSPSLDPRSIAGLG